VLVVVVVVGGVEVVVVVVVIQALLSSTVPRAASRTASTAVEIPALPGVAALGTAMITMLSS